MGNLTEKDHLILADLVYFDIINDSNLYREYQRGKLTVGELANVYLNNEEYKKRFKTDTELQAFEAKMSELANPSSKYYDWKVSHVEDNNKETGFVGYTFVPDSDPTHAVIAFRGSEDMTKLEHLTTDWRNNYTTIHDDFTFQQREALEYLQKQAEKYDSLSVTGHSLGGNNALASSILADDKTKSKITEVLTFNAPGFSSEFIDKNKDSINQMKERIQEFQNVEDLVSSLFNNPTDPIYVETSIKKSDGPLTYLDPIISLGDHHSLEGFVVNEDGTFQRAKRKNSSLTFISLASKNLESLPNWMLKDFGEAVFAMINRGIKKEELLLAGIILSSNPHLVVTVAQVAKVVLGALFIAFTITTLTQEIIYFFEDNAQKIHEAFVSFVDEAFEALLQLGVALIGIDQFRQMLYKEIHEFFSSLRKQISEWFGRGSQGASTSINVDLYQLRSIIPKLQRIHNKIQHVDVRLDTLRGLMEDLDQKIAVAFIDYSVGYDSELIECIRYIERAVDSIEDCEREILKKAHAF